MNVLVLNAGSSSLKYQLRNTATQEILASGICERVGTEESFHRHGLGNEQHIDKVHLKNHDDAIAVVIKALTEGPSKSIEALSEIDAIGHRVVHGGEYFDQSALITKEAEEQITELATLAPLHNPPALTVIDACAKQIPDAPMVAVFDTSFFQTLKPKSYMYPLPYDLYEEHGIRKYGMHGTSHRYVSGKAADFLGTPIEDLKIITLHLGNGCSASAIKGGVAIDTSMGLTPLDGLMMGTRCGAIDPAIVPFVMDLKGLSTSAVNDLMNKKSGLLGISGLSNDLRTVHEAADAGNERAQLAIEMYANAVKKYIGQYMAMMGGVDTIVFTAGIGENSSYMRSKILEGLEDLGIVLNEDKNAARGGARSISGDDSRVDVLVVPTDEEYMIARDTHDIVEALN